MRIIVCFFILLFFDALSNRSNGGWPNCVRLWWVVSMRWSIPNFTTNGIGLHEGCGRLQERLRRPTTSASVPLAERSPYVAIWAFIEAHPWQSDWENVSSTGCRISTSRRKGNGLQKHCLRLISTKSNSLWPNEYNQNITFLNSYDYRFCFMQIRLCMLTIRV